MEILKKEQTTVWDDWVEVLEKSRSQNTLYHGLEKARIVNTDEKLPASEVLVDVRNQYVKLMPEWVPYEGGRIPVADILATFIALGALMEKRQSSSKSTRKAVEKLQDAMKAEPGLGKGMEWNQYWQENYQIGWD